MTTNGAVAGCMVVPNHKTYVRTDLTQYWEAGVDSPLDVVAWELSLVDMRVADEHGGMVPYEVH